MNPAPAGVQPPLRPLNAPLFPRPGSAPRASLGDVVLHHLRTPEEIGSIVFLRDEIDLSVHTSAGASFTTLEKKETNAESSAGSRSRENGSAPFASSQSACS